MNAQILKKGFSYLLEVDESIQQELRYFSSNNFIGKKIDGYKKNTVIISNAAAKALKKVQAELMQMGLSLKVYDAYRPQQSVDHFVRWAKKLNDTLMKQSFYPTVRKSDLFKLGFIASKSGHTRGSSVDLSIVEIKTNKEIDMGSSYDFFGATSYSLYKKLSSRQEKNRMFLRNIMIKNGFNPYDKEWWHYTLVDEPFPNTYFNFDIE
ncbi:M15 family metallopeptidase [Flavobacteriaceae bacterium]|nr:M15 family metallopeptidase [Flavobacteriaceae bacterium]MDB2633499.1 M15 family metallopeptidase [Flavobacteriaceae bacterium]MDB2684718.1 M15 family metallopeptidase [Flavobacteriaceae bacterium]MDC0331119.1 M15 family metallopeptidase [Flavobacteriaceae bacterium]